MHHRWQHIHQGRNKMTGAVYKKNCLIHKLTNLRKVVKESIIFIIIAGWLCVTVTAMQDEVFIGNGLILCRKLRCDTGYFDHWITCRSSSRSLFHVIRNHNTH